MKIRNIKLLQLTVIISFSILFITGFIVWLFWEQKLESFKSLVSTFFPMFITIVIPALIGEPLSEAVKNITGKKE